MDSIWLTAFSRPGQMDNPCVAVSKDHVCDGGNDRVQIFRKSDGVHVRELRHAASDELETTIPYFISLWHTDRDIHVTVTCKIKADTMHSMYCGGNSSARGSGRKPKLCGCILFL